MSLFRTAANAAVASSVHGRVQRRQRDRWAAQSQAAPVVAPAPVVAAAPVPQGGPAALDTEALLSALERLAALREKGVLTEAEFEQQKALILAG
ncbi:MAG: SHOCT domain-containing protein [Rhodococcus sp. (in: high G+C Gram-positive bacteria)]|uniref:SHOCT domain-containing protein n=1 Tax=Rhodococcus sp. TaxID=1831 RepID=UPI003BB5D948